MRAEDLSGQEEKKKERVGKGVISVPPSPLLKQNYPIPRTKSSILTKISCGNTLPTKALVLKPSTKTIFPTLK